MPLKELLDPKGKAVAGSMKNLNLNAVQDVRIGKHIQLHIEAKPPSDLTKAQIEALQCLANGDRHAAAAEKLGITESAFKARVQSARIRLEARTASEAIRKAREYRLL